MKTIFVPVTLLQLGQMLTRALVLCLLGLFASTLSAQSGPAKAPPPQLITFFTVGGQEYYSMDSEADPRAQFKFKVGSAIHSLDLTPGLIAGPFSRPRSENLVLFRETPDPTDPKLPPKIVTVAEANLPSNAANVIVLVAANKQGAIRIQPLDQSLASLPESQLSFVNLSRLNLAVRLGEGKTQIAPQARQSLPVGLAGKDAAMVKLQIAIQEGDAWNMVKSQSIALSPKDRRLVLITSGESSPIRITVLDPAPADPVEPDAATPQAPPATSTR
jgi:hypothetical protein